MCDISLLATEDIDARIVVDMKNPAAETAGRPLFECLFFGFISPQKTSIDRYTQCGQLPGNNKNCDREARKIVNESKTISKAFLAALRMEFHLLHPAFNTLFHYMKIVEEKNKWNPEEEYESHINEFIDAFHRYGKSKQEMSLLGLTLNRLWHENKNLAIMSSADVLTGILNRRGFFNVIQPLSYLAQRNNLSVGFMMIDIDHFKQINDRYGHQKGDKILAKIASILRTNIRTSDIMGRYGGEEFIIFL